MIHNEIIDFFFKRTSSEIKKRITSSSLSYEDIYPNNPKMLSYVTNNKVTDKNPYLLYDIIIKSLISTIQKNGTEIQLFINETDVLWGNNLEINNYIDYVYSYSFTYIMKNHDKFDIDKELLLLNYVPYVKYRTYYELYNNPNRNPIFELYGMAKDVLSYNYPIQRKNAYHFLYNLIKNDFECIFKKFIENTKTYKKIDTEFDKFLKIEFCGILKNYYPNAYSISMRIKNLIKKDLFLAEKVITNPKNPENINNRALISATSSYIVELEKIYSHNEK